MKEVKIGNEDIIDTFIAHKEKSIRRVNNDAGNYLADIPMDIFNNYIDMAKSEKIITRREYHILKLSAYGIPDEHISAYLTAAGRHLSKRSVQAIKCRANKKLDEKFGESPIIDGIIFEDSKGL